MNIKSASEMLQQHENFNLLKLSYFDSFYDNIDNQNNDFIISSEKKTIYCNVYTFMKCIKFYDVILKHTF